MISQNLIRSTVQYIGYGLGFFLLFFFFLSFSLSIWRIFYIFMLLFCLAKEREKSVGKEKKGKNMCHTCDGPFNNTHQHREGTHREENTKKKKNIFIFVLFSKEGRRREKKRCWNMSGGPFPISRTWWSIVYTHTHAEGGGPLYLPVLLVDKCVTEGLLWWLLEHRERTSLCVKTLFDVGRHTTNTHSPQPPSFFLCSIFFLCPVMADCALRINGHLSTLSSPSFSLSLFLLFSKRFQLE